MIYTGQTQAPQAVSFNSSYSCW